MKKNRIQLVAKYIAPTLLVLVACIQFFLVKSHNLTQWKGGGFGMFSTFDKPSERILYAQFLINRDIIPLMLTFSNEIEKQRRRTEIFPTDVNFERIIHKLKEQDWYCSIWKSEIDDEFQYESFTTDDRCLLAVPELIITVDKKKLLIEDEIHLRLNKLNYEISEGEAHLVELKELKVDFN